MVIGVDKLTIRQVLEDEIERVESHDLHAAQVFESMGGYSPTIGILGAVLGLIQVMRHLSEPSELGLGIAVAFVATIYGVGMANLIFLPVANKLKMCIAHKVHYEEMIVEGMVAIASGESPGILLLKLNNFGQHKKNESKKKGSEQQNDHHRWVVSYADFITLLFAFFVVMYAISSVNISKYRSLSEGMKSAFNKKDAARALKSTDNKKDGPQTKQFHGLFNDGLDDLHQSLAELEDGNYKINRQEGWIELDIKSGALFESGEADLKPEAFVKLMQVANKIKKSTSIISVEGYTDNVPIETPQFPSNWELSAMRAAVVGRTLNSFGISAQNLLVTGYGEQFPVADNITAQGRAANRRVSIIIALNRNIPRLLNPELSEQAHRVVIGNEDMK